MVVKGQHLVIRIQQGTFYSATAKDGSTSFVFPANKVSIVIGSDVEDDHLNRIFSILDEVEATKVQDLAEMPAISETT